MSMFTIPPPAPRLKEEHLDNKSSPHKWMRHLEPFELGLICLVAFKRRTPPHHHPWVVCQGPQWSALASHQMLNRVMVFVPLLFMLSSSKEKSRAAHITTERSAWYGSLQQQIWKLNHFKIQLVYARWKTKSFLSVWRTEDFPQEIGQLRWSALPPL